LSAPFLQAMKYALPLLLGLSAQVSFAPSPPAAPEV
jgi:hypothetical protein